MSNNSVLLAIWNDIAPERVDEYEAWHTLEHVPERVWVPGFERATRYVACGSAHPAYLTLYEVASLDVLRTPPYVDLVDNPTDWSASMRPSFANFLRQPCHVIASAGYVSGGSLLASRFALPERQSAARLSNLAEMLYARGTRLALTRVQIGEVVSAGPQALTNTGPKSGGVEYLAIVEAATESGATQLSALLDDAACGLLDGALYRTEAVYRFASRVEHADVEAPRRPLQRSDLMSQWHETTSGS